jgi:hypothetical protein
VAPIARQGGTTERPSSKVRLARGLRTPSSKLRLARGVRAPSSKVRLAQGLRAPSGGVCLPRWLNAPSGRVRLARGLSAPSGGVRLARGLNTPSARTVSLEGTCTHVVRAPAPVRAFNALTPQDPRHNPDTPRNRVPALFHRLPGGGHPRHYVALCNEARVSSATLCCLPPYG